MKNIFVKILTVLVAIHSVQTRRYLRNYTVNNLTSFTHKTIGLNNFTIHNVDGDDFIVSNVQNNTNTTRADIKASDPYYGMKLRLTSSGPQQRRHNYSIHFHIEHDDEIQATTTPTPRPAAKLGAANFCQNSNEYSIEECILHNAVKAHPLHHVGGPALCIQPLEPLVIPSISLHQHKAPSENFKYEAWLSDVKLFGLSNFLFNDLEVDPKELKISANISLPYIVVAGDFVILGEFQMLPVESTGRITGNLSLCSAFLEAQGARVFETVKRIIIESVNVRFQCHGEPYVNLNEVHSTTKEMERISIHLVKQHLNELSKEVQPAIESAVSVVLENVANKFLNEIRIVFNN